MKEMDVVCFFCNLKVVAATAITFINRIRVRDASATTELIYHMLAARGGIRGFQPSPSHTHTHAHTQVFKENLEKICYKCIPVCSFFPCRCKASESPKLLISRLSGKNDARVQVTNTLNTIL